jgi:hypothetical protein
VVEWGGELGDLYTIGREIQDIRAVQQHLPVVKEKNYFCTSDRKPGRGPLENNDVCCCLLITVRNQVTTKDRAKPVNILDRGIKEDYGPT